MKSLHLLLLAGMMVQSSESEWTDVADESQFMDAESELIEGIEGFELLNSCEKHRDALKLSLATAKKKQKNFLNQTASFLMQPSESEILDADSELIKVLKCLGQVQKTTRYFDDHKEQKNFLNQPASILMQPSESEFNVVEKLRDQVHETTKRYEDDQRKYQSSFNQLLREEKFLKFVNDQKGKKHYHKMNIAINCVDVPNVDVLQGVESFLEPREALQMKSASTKLSKLHITGQLNLFPNESSVQLFRNMEFSNEIIWNDPNDLISDERKENVEKCLRIEKFELPNCLFDEVRLRLAKQEKTNCLFDEVSKWDPNAETYPFFKEVLFSVLKTVDLERKKRGNKILLLGAIDFNAPKDVTRLIERRVGVNLEESIYGQGYKPLALAARQNRLEIVKILIKARAEVDGLTEYLGSPLCVAAIFGHVEILKYLLKKNADVHDANSLDGYTPLHFAAENGNAENVKLLLDAGANVNQENRCRYTSLHNAARKGNVEAMEILLAGGADAHVEGAYWTPLNIAVAFSFNVEAVKILVSLKVNLDFQDLQGRTALIIAADQGTLDIVKILLQAGANTEKTSKFAGTDQFGKTAAQIAVQRGHQNCADEINNFKNSLN